MGVGLSGVGGCIVPPTLSELFFSELFKFPRLGVEERDLASVGLPELFSLVEGILWGATLVFVGVIGIHLSRATRGNAGIEVRESNC